MQENTFQHISKEIHDNINLSLTLAKLNLNTLDCPVDGKYVNPIRSSIDLITESIENLSNISKSLNSDIIANQGLIAAIEYEIAKIKKISLFKLDLTVSGNEIFLNNQKELIIFRILQESLNNILKHSKASDVQVLIHYEEAGLTLTVFDNGEGFNISDIKEFNKNGKAGLKNMETRTNSLSGKMKINTGPGLGTKLIFHIPY